MSSPTISPAPWIPLSHSLHDAVGAAGVSGAAAFSFSNRRIDADSALQVTRMDMAVHTGTHVDAPRHFIPDGATMDQIDRARLIGPGVVLDVARGPEALLTAADFEVHRHLVRRGDIVLLDLGFGRHFDRDAYRLHPYFSEDAAEWLVDAGVTAVGVDVLSPDLPEPRRPEGFAFPIHRRLLGADVLIIENLSAALDDLRGHRVDVLVAPVVIEGADGGPCAAFARIVS